MPQIVRSDEYGRPLLPADLRRDLDLCPDDVLLRRDQMLAPPSQPQPPRGQRLRRILDGIRGLL